MRKWMSICFILAMLALLSLGCAEITNERKVKCPKCGPDIMMQTGMNKSIKYQ